MTKYEPITFTKLSEAIAYVEDGGELYDPIREIPLSIADTCEAFSIGLQMYTKAKPAPWYEKLDGTIENRVLCWVDDGDDGEEKNIDVVVDIDEARTYASYIALTCRWKYATPLTRTEIQKFMDNAPEEV